MSEQNLDKVFQKSYALLKAGNAQQAWDGFCQSRELAAAGESLDQTIDFCEQTAAQLPGLPDVFSTLAVCYRRSAEIQKTLEYHTLALSGYQKQGDLDSQAFEIGGMGVCSLMCGNFPQAIEYLNKAQTIAQSSQIERYLLRQLYTCYTAQQDKDAAQTTRQQMDAIKNWARRWNEFDVILPDEITNNAGLRNYFIQRLGRHYSSIAFIQMSREYYLALLHGDSALLDWAIKADSDASEELILSYAGDTHNSVILTFNIETAYVGERFLSFIDAMRKIDAQEEFARELKALANKMQMVHRLWLEQSIRYYDLATVNGKVKVSGPGVPA